jgi:uncharacterized protein YndB with AHSA1/START domain
MSENTQTLQDVVVERVLDTSAETVWKLWTDPEHFKHWYGPQGFSVPVARFDLRVGGERTVCMEMQTPEGARQMWTTGEHLELTPAARLVYTESMADADGNKMQMDGFPHDTRVTVELTAQDGGTHMRLTHAGLPEGAEGADMGWKQAFDKLADYIERL